jgi:adenine deaminase
MSKVADNDPLARQQRLAVALKREPADTVLRNARILDVHTGLIESGGIAIVADRIAYVGEIEDLIGSQTKVIEAERKCTVPGLIEGHIHTYESHLPIREIARGFFQHGVTTIITDFYGEAVVRGVQAIKASLSEGADTRLNIVFILPMPALYQDEPFLHTRTINFSEMQEMATWPSCHGLNECFIRNLTGGEPMLRKLVDIIQARGGKVCGHGSEGKIREVQAWAGWVRRLDDHEAVSGEEALDRIKAGIHIIAREGSGVSDVAHIARFLMAKGADLRRVSFCTDILSPVDLTSRGSIDHCVRLCIGLGVPPVTAIQMATLNSAECHQIDDDVGSLSPGRRADVILLDGELEHFKIDTVLAAGEVVVENGQNLVQYVNIKRPSFAYKTVNPGEVSAENFVAKAPPGIPEVTVRVIGVADGTIITRELERRLPVKAGVIRCAPELGINQIAAIDRHTGSGKLGLGFVEGFGLEQGAVASTYNPHYQHLLIVGANPDDMAAAATECARQGGGFVVVHNGKILAQVPMPLYGLLSEDPIDKLAAEIETTIAELRKLGCPLKSPFHTLAFTGLPVSIGTLKISSVGLIDVWRGQTVPLIVSTAHSAECG